MEPLRDYQRSGRDALIANKRFILADEMGLGKTRQALEAMVNITDHAFPRILVVCPKVAVFVWQTEIEKWFPELIGEVRILLGDALKRNQVLEDLKAPYILITTYDILKRDVDKMPQSYHLIITDEAHRYRNRTTKTFKAVKKLHGNYVFQLTGTPASRGPQDVWTMLNLIDPKRFGSYWRFVNTYCLVHEGVFGKEILGPKNVEALRMLLKSYLLRRKKVDVIEDLPEKTRSKIIVEMTPKQRKLYDQFEKHMIAALPDGGMLITPNSLGKFVRLRQMLIWPHLLYKIEEEGKLDQGAGFSAILEHMSDNDDKHVVIFTPFAKALNGFGKALKVAGYAEDSIIQLRGGTNPDEVRKRIELFESARGIALCTIKFAQSFNLSTASTAYFLGYEFNPDENHQAEDRLHRMTSKSAVNIYYVCHKDSIDEHILTILNDKNRSISSFLKAPDGSLQVLGG